MSEMADPLNQWEIPHQVREQCKHAELAYAHLDGHAPLTPHTVDALWTSEIQPWLTSKDHLQIISSWLTAVTGLDHNNCGNMEEAYKHFIHTAVCLLQGHIDLANLQLQAWKRKFQPILHNKPISIVDNLVYAVEEELECPSPGSQRQETFEESCQQWKEVLKKHVLESLHLPVPPMQEDPVIQVMRQMKNFTQTDLDNTSFSLTVVKTGLAVVMLRIANPKYVHQVYNPENLHQTRLLRRNGISLQLVEILNAWSKRVPEEWLAIPDEGSLNETVPKNIFQQRNGKLKTGNDFIRILCKHQKIVPLATNPLCCFFLCSEANFKQAWEEWLRWGLNASGFDVPYDPHDHRVLALWNAISQHIMRGQYNTHGLPQEIEQLLRLTIQLRQETKIFKSQVRKPNQCQHCLGQPEAQKCTQTLYFQKCSQSFSWKGAGLTRVPSEEAMRPVQPKMSGRSKSLHTSKHSSVPKIHQAKDLDFQEVYPNPEILKNCGHQIFFIRDTDTQEMINWVYYNSFHKDYLQTLNTNIDLASHVNPVARGSQFEWYKFQPLRPFGWRVGSGAGPAEFANAHVGIEATTYEGLDILFNHAWNNMALVETARPFVPDIVEEIAKTGKLCGKVGFLGVNSFDCKNYVATIHRDNDKAPTITAQLRLNGTNLARSEFSFCMAEYGFFIRTQANMIWSFDSNVYHGTMLPAQATLDLARIGQAESIGVALAVGSRNAARAQSIHSLHDTYNKIFHVWNRHV
ncbi:hypothetical protein GGU11DRAFT_750835 [Lentinula aff. detonsa]|nr:hypothetical protein GGU11DRAFT_750835 [Lentinula aff. detonsa]